MSERLNLYKCNICGNLIEVVLAGAGELVCCGALMELLDAKTHDGEFDEKHVPVFADIDNNSLEIRVGSKPHPMTDEHYIQFIETVSEDKNRIIRQYLTASDAPVMKVCDKNTVKSAREYCNIHGLWEGVKDSTQSD